MPKTGTPQQQEKGFGVIMKTRTLTQGLRLLVCCSVWLTACAGPEPETRAIAISFAVALRSGDTTALHELVEADKLRSVLADRPDTSDPRLRFKTSNPSVRFRAASDTQSDYLVEADTSIGEIIGVWVGVTRSPPYKVRFYGLFPEVWPPR